MSGVRVGFVQTGGHMTGVLSIDRMVNIFHGIYSDFAATLRHAGDVANATKYTRVAEDLAKRLRARPATTGGEW